MDIYDTIVICICRLTIFNGRFKGLRPARRPSKLKFEKGKQYPDLYKHVVASMSIPCFLQAQKIKKELLMYKNKYIDYLRSNEV